MTRSKSDAQLDAEAAGGEQSLFDLIEDHRALYHSDLFNPRLHKNSGETEDEDAGRATKMTNGHQGGWTGLPFTGPFLRYINWSRDRQEQGVRPTSTGQTFPWSTAFTAQWADCRRYHPEHHGRPEWRGSLCRQLVSLTVRSEPSLSVESACLVLGVTPPRAGRTLRNALYWIEASMDRARSRQEERAKPLMSRILWRESKDHEKHDLPGLHAEDCPQCRKGAA